MMLVWLMAFCNLPCQQFRYITTYRRHERPCYFSQFCNPVSRNYLRLPLLATQNTVGRGLKYFYTSADFHFLHRTLVQLPINSLNLLEDMTSILDRVDQ